MPPVKPVSGETQDDERARREREGRLVRRVLTAVSIALTPALGEAIDAPTGPILGARVEHLGAKEALLADDPDVFFTTPHFDGYPAVLVRLPEIALDELEELIFDAWRCQAPRTLVEAFERDER